ncbi:DUF1800 domain-containing protein [bacterium]|nr:DUF1800 domain-containing protein [bacterium]
MMTVREACWLLRCSGFGAPPSEVQRMRRLGYQAAVESLLNVTLETADPPLTTRVPTGQMLTMLQLGGLIGWWLQRMTKGGLREKMTLFWHGFFTTSVDPVFSAGLLLCQNQLLRENALGKFEDLLQQVSRDPAMMIYLDGFRNRAEHPNENFAREVMEMFTTGPGNYSEEDLRQAAKAFTGWELAWARGGQFRENRAAHDNSSKRFKELRGQLDGGQILHRLARDPATARHVCSRLWEFFTALPADPLEVSRLAAVFGQSHGNMRVVLRSLLTGEAFREAASPRRSIKSPLEFCLEMNRVLGRDWRLKEADDLKRMGQLPFLPPSVAGWRQGQGWIDTSTLQRRICWVQQRLLEATALGKKQKELLAGCKPAQAADRLLWLTHQVDAGPQLRQLVEQHQHRPEVLQLILTSPEVHLR